MNVRQIMGCSHQNVKQILLKFEKKDLSEYLMMKMIKESSELN